jgi:hypothetical protein
MGPNEMDLVVHCEDCHKKMTRRDNMVFLVAPNIQGETCSNSCKYAGFDEGLGMHITGKQHRAAVMKEKGLTEYNPDLKMKRYRDEAKYVRSQAPKGDPDAAAAASKIHKTATDERRTNLIRKSLDKSFKKAEVQ